MNIFEIAQAISTVEKRQAANQSMLIYGDPKAGKTRLAATVARVPEVTGVYWFDTENGSETLFDMVRSGALTPEEAKKITLIKIVDLPEQAIAWHTVVNCLVTQKPQRKPNQPYIPHFRLCPVHGRIECPDCKLVETETKVPTAWLIFDITKLKSTDWIVIDSLSQVAESAINYIMKGQDYSIKAGWDEYGFQGRVMSDILTVVQSAPFCNYLAITHQLLFESKDDDKKMASEQTLKEMFSKLYPLVGSKNFSLRVGKYFGHVIYVEKVLKKHKAGSGSTYKSDVITGSRGGMLIEKEEEADLRLVFAKMGWTAWTPKPTAAPVVLPVAPTAVKK